MFAHYLHFVTDIYLLLVTHYELDLSLDYLHLYILRGIYLLSAFLWLEVMVKTWLDLRNKESIFLGGAVKDEVWKFSHHYQWICGISNFISFAKDSLRFVLLQMLWRLCIAAQLLQVLVIKGCLIDIFKLFFSHVVLWVTELGFEHLSLI